MMKSPTWMKNSKFFGTKGKTLWLRRLSCLHQPSWRPDCRGARSTITGTGLNPLLMLMSLKRTCISSSSVMMAGVSHSRKNPGYAEIGVSVKVFNWESAVEALETIAKVVSSNLGHLIYFSRLSAPRPILPPRRDRAKFFYLNKLRSALSGFPFISPLPQRVAE